LPDWSLTEVQAWIDLNKVPHQRQDPTKRRHQDEKYPERYPAAARRRADQEQDGDRRAECCRRCSQVKQSSPGKPLCRGSRKTIERDLRDTANQEKNSDANE
jgi:hypothetical protein